MGAVVPLLTSSIGTQALGLVVDQISQQGRRASEKQAQKQMQAQQELRQRQAAEDAALRREGVMLDSRQADEERKAALKRAVARQRANFGAQGVGAGAGSSQAVLLGMFEESEDEKSRREELDNLRLNGIDQDLQQGRALNVLQRTQLAERNKLNRMRSYGQTATDAIPFGLDVYNKITKDDEG